MLEIGLGSVVKNKKGGNNYGWLVFWWILNVPNCTCGWMDTITLVENI